MVCISPLTSTLPKEPVEVDEPLTSPLTSVSEANLILLPPPNSSVLVGCSCTLRPVLPTVRKPPALTFPSEVMLPVDWIVPLELILPDAVMWLTPKRLLPPKPTVVVVNCVVIPPATILISSEPKFIDVLSSPRKSMLPCIPILFALKLPLEDITWPSTLPNEPVKAVSISPLDEMFPLAVICPKNLWFSDLYVTPSEVPVK